MINETGVLAAVAHDRGSFAAVVDHLDGEMLSAHGLMVWKSICAWYEKDPEARTVDTKAILARLVKSYPAHAKAFGRLLRAMTPEAGTKNVTRDVLELKREAVGNELALAITNHADPAEIADLITAYSAVNDAAGLLDSGGLKLFNRRPSEVIAATEEAGARTKLLPMAVNNVLRGGLLPGHCVVVHGRVNVGKSAFAINATAGFLKQGKRVLYIENEDLCEDTYTRVCCRLVGCNRDWADANRAEYDRLCDAKGIDRLYLPDPAPATLQDVDAALAQLTPDVCVVNQARNFAKDGDNLVQQLDRIAQTFRAMGKRRRIIMVLITAAKEGTEEYNGRVREKPILEMADAYSSKTGFPAAADVMIGFGSSASLEERDMACLHVCKNKLGGKKAVIYVTVDFPRGLIKEAD